MSAPLGSMLTSFRFSPLPRRQPGWDAFCCCGHFFYHPAASVTKNDAPARGRERRGLVGTLA